MVAGCRFRVSSRSYAELAVREVSAESFATTVLLLRGELRYRSRRDLQIARPKPMDPQEWSAIIPIVSKNTLS